jgi:hypothetical protein
VVEFGSAQSVEFPSIPRSSVDALRRSLGVATVRKEDRRDRRKRRLRKQSKFKRISMVYPDSSFAQPVGGCQTQKHSSTGHKGRPHTKAELRPIPSIWAIAAATRCSTRKTLPSPIERCSGPARGRRLRSPSRDADTAEKPRNSLTLRANRIRRLSNTNYHSPARREETDTGGERVSVVAKTTAGARLLSTRETVCRGARLSPICGGVARRGGGLRRRGSPRGPRARDRGRAPCKTDLYFTVEDNRRECTRSASPRPHPIAKHNPPKRADNQIDRGGAAGGRHLAPGFRWVLGIPVG